jgi:hypothetical protein
MPVASEPFAAVYEDRNRLGVIVARTGRVRSLRGRRSLRGTVSDPGRGRAAITHGALWPKRKTFSPHSPAR